jgi:hypothetical protein
MGLPFIREVYLKDDYEMKELIDNWREFQTDIRLEEAMAGLSKKEREQVKRNRKSSERVRRSLGVDGDLHPGKSEMDKLAAGMMEAEVDEANKAHDKRTGRFPKGGPKKGDVYSLSKKGARASGIDPDKYSKKGVYSGGKKKDGTDKTHGKYGMADKCGSLDLQGNKIPERYYCSDYKKPYNEHQEEEEVSGEERVSREYVAGTIRMEIDRAIKSLRDELGKGQAGCSLDQVIRIVDKFENATKGKAFITKPPSPV